MKLLCDVHISYKVVNFLAKHANEVIHVNNILDKWYTTDKAICEYADKHDFIVVSEDKDFKNSHLIHSSPRKLLLIALGNLNSDHIINTLGKAIKIIKEKNKQPVFYIELSGNALSFIQVGPSYCGIKDKYELHHGTRMKDDAILAAVQRSHHCVSDRLLPDKAIGLMIEAADSALEGLRVKQLVEAYFGGGGTQARWRNKLQTSSTRSRWLSDLAKTNSTIHSRHTKTRGAL